MWPFSRWLGATVQGNLASVYHTDGLELPQSVRDSSLPERGRAVLVSCAHGACDPASADAGDGWGRGPLSAHHRLHGRVPAAAASRKAMGQVLWRGLSGLRLLRLDYSHRKTALAFVTLGRMAEQGRRRVLGSVHV